MKGILAKLANAYLSVADKWRHIVLALHFYGVLKREVVVKPEDLAFLLKLILIENSAATSLGSIRNMGIEDLEDAELRCLATRKTDRKRVAFFSPKAGLTGNFGDIPVELAKLGCEVVWLFGSPSDYLESKERNKWLVLNDMVRRISGIDAIVTSSVMDCLPDDCAHVLHDHLSYAHFDLDWTINELLTSPNRKTRKYESIREMNCELSAFVAFLPFYDLVLTSSNSVTDVTRRALQFVGYGDGQVCSGKAPNRLELSNISHLVDIGKYRERVVVQQSGYCKLDIPARKYASVSPEKTIVYAPTPNDTSGNKEGALWNLAIGIGRDGPELVVELCERFPDFTIVFKPYKDELAEIVERYRQIASTRKNLVIDQCGSDYWDLYSRSKVLISDFSSTAYTFALGTGRPVVFFSPNENELPELLLSNTYCKDRESVGLVARSVDEVVGAISTIFSDYDHYLSRVSTFRSKNGMNAGEASFRAATAIAQMMEGNLELTPVVFRSQ
jgi:hypothetical protein